ncbi:MAG: peptide deformylase [Acidobacteria bacterium]|nr:peptide deformylase [Acidobacteriota bacterium]
MLILSESGAEKTITARGDLSELLQHEIDHLDGILYKHRAIGNRNTQFRCDKKQLSPTFICY